MRSCNPAFAEADPDDEKINYYVERIARTELNRILFYAKEQYAIQDGELDRLYLWTGPLDRRTTPMCRFLQTGELTGEDANGKPYDYERLRGLLPEWKEDGWPLDVLKENVRIVHDVFYDAGAINTPMPSDWQCHINCRHTFRAGSVIPKEIMDEPVVMDGWMQPQSMPESPMGVEMNGAYIMADETDSESVYIDELEDALIPFGVADSIHEGTPAYYLPTDDINDDEPVFMFESGDEFDIGKWAVFAFQETQAGMSEYDIRWTMTDESMFTMSEIAYLMDNCDWLTKVAFANGWAV